MVAFKVAMRKVLSASHFKRAARREGASGKTSEWLGGGQESCERAEASQLSRSAT